MEKSSNPTLAYLKLSSPFPELAVYIKNYTKIEVEGLDVNEYQAKIDKISTQLFSVKLEYKIRAVKNPLVKVIFLLPIFIENHYNKILVKKEVSLILKSYFDNEELSKEVLEKTSSISQKIGTLTSGLIFMATMAKPRSSFSFRGKMIIGTVQNLR